MILAEIGMGMSVFPSESHLSSWAGLSPGNNESAGKKRTKTTQGNQALKSALLEAAWAAGRTRSFLGSKFWSVAGRKGNKRSTVVVAHKVLVIAYYVLKTENSHPI